MARTLLTLATLLGAAALSACGAGSRAAVPVRAAPADIATLAGEWAGEYSSAATGRSGSILLTLAAGRDTAYGDVLMVPRGSAQPFLADPRPGGASAAARPASTGLTIRFVRIAGDSVSGVLDPYRAPDCDCVLMTTFVGTVRDDRIEGTFATQGDPRAATQTGRWAVTRRRPG